MKRLCFRRALGSKKRSGAAIVELAVVLPVLLLLLMGTIQACAAIHLQQSLDITAYEAAGRTFAIPGAPAQARELAKINTIAGKGTELADSDFTFGQSQRTKSTNPIKQKKKVQFFQLFSRQQDHC
jgi:Flp pilus assembly protein TadG